MTTAIGPAAWVIDDTGFPKFGRYSVGVAPQYCGALGKVANCQVGVSVHAATDQASCPLDWPVILADAAYGEVNQFRLGLEQRELAYVVQVPGTISAYTEDMAPETLPYAGRGQPSKPRYRQPRSSLQQLVLDAGEQAARTLTWREGADGAPLVSRFVALRVRPAGVQLRRAARG